MIKISDKNSVNSSNFICDQETAIGAPIADLPNSKASAAEGNLAALPQYRDASAKMGLLLFNLSEAKSMIRQQVESQLEKGVSSLPELVDPLVNYLLEVVQEDPEQRALFGCKNP